MLSIRRPSRTRLLGTLLTVAAFGASGTLIGGQARPAAPAGRGTAVAPARAGQRAASRGPAAQAGRPVRVLFLGMDEERPHNPARMFPHLAAPLARRGIQLTYVA